ncbi:MAG: PilZ domain-containing protein [Rhodospirillaceae bacterium]
MRVGSAEEARRHKRVEFSKPFHGVAENDEFHGVIQDISGGGAAVAVDSSSGQLSNFDFVEMHIQSLDKKIPAQVVRKYEGGFAVQFEVTAQEQDRIQDEIDQFQEAGGSRSA